MKATYISDFQPNQLVKDAVLLVRAKDVRQKKTGEPYLSLVLGDRAGEIEAKMWDNVAGVLETFGRDDFVKVKGLVQVYQNRPQLTLHTLQRVSESDVDFADFFPASKRAPADMFVELRGLIDGMGNAHLKALLTAVFDDEEIAARFRKAPAAKMVHHAYLGGLIEHVLQICALCQVVAPHYPDVDVELLLAGAILHDVGKIHELIYNRSFSYSTDGQLLGHIVIGLQMVDEKLRGIPDFPPKLRGLIEHMILSHHGELAFGSPKVPLFAEAMLLHQLDNLDSKMECMRSLIEQDRQVEGVWTSYNNVLERPILKKVKYLEDGVGEAPEGPSTAAAPAPSAPRTIEQLQLLINAKRNP
jgi:3'-5' exoribonuclease